MYVQGCAADINPLPRRSVALARIYGQILAAAVEQVIDGEMMPVAGPLRTSYGLVDLPFQQLPTRAQLEKEAKSEDYDRRWRGKRMLARLDRGESLPDHYADPVQVWRFGRDLNLIALGGEVVSDYSLRLKKEYGFENTWVAAYSNDVFGYVGSRRVIHEGGYEGGGANTNFPAPFSEAVEDLIVEKGRRFDAGHLMRILLMLAAALPLMAADPWKAGVAQAVITPKEPIWMAGYGDRVHPSEGVLRDLYVKALALDSGDGKPSVIVTADLLGFPKEIAETIAARCEKQYGLTRARLVLNASHTHSAPVVSRHAFPIFNLEEKQWQAIDRYSTFLTDKSVAVIGAALQNIAPATVKFEQGFAGIAVNRRRAHPGTRGLIGQGGSRCSGDDGRGPGWKAEGNPGRLCVSRDRPQSLSD